MILIYDNNRITVDGNIDNCFTDDTSAKLKATGWEVIEVEDGSNDVRLSSVLSAGQSLTLAQLAAIVAAFDEAKAVKGKPVCVNIRTIIGFGSANQDTGPVHGAALGDNDVAHVKAQLGFDPDAKFVVPPEVYHYFTECKPKGAKLEAEWNEMLEKYSKQYPDEFAELQSRRQGKILDGWKEMLPSKADLPQSPAPTRKASGIALQTLVPKCKTFTAGSADLMESTFVNFKDQVEFQNVSARCLSTRN